MYADFETKTSYKYLKQVIAALEEPVCVLGGWAVFLHVNKSFQKAQGRPYLGSRDIDLGFHLDKNATTEQLKQSALAKSLDVLQHKLGFRSVSFRLLKEVHTETEEEISEGTIIPAHFVFPMYVDVIVDNIPEQFKEVFRFQPADEPLLQFAFDDAKNRKELEEFNRRLLLPTPALLLATKINALKQRDKEHKKVKDICDIFALLWYSEETPQALKEKCLQFINAAKIKEIISTITLADYEKASQQLGHTAEEVERVIHLLE